MKIENIAGKKFEELDKKEMLEVIGGTNPKDNRSFGALGSLASGFVISWIASAAFNCKK